MLFGLNLFITAPYGVVPILLYIRYKDIISPRKGRKNMILFSNFCANKVKTQKIGYKSALTITAAQSEKLK